MTKKAKFFIACAVIFVLGAAMTIVGKAAGGLDYLQNNGIEAADRVVTQNKMEFDSVEVSGTVDIELVGSRYYREVLADYELRGDAAEEIGNIIVITDEGKEVPDVKADDGKLMIDAPDQYKSKLYCPTVIIFCSDEAMKSIKVRAPYSDMNISGVSFENADIENDSGDIDCKDIMSNGIRIKSDAGSVDISGVLEGLTDVTAEAGDIEVRTFAGLPSYTMDLSATAGDITIGDKEIEGGSYTQEGGESKLILKTSAGDIKVDNR